MRCVLLGDITCLCAQRPQIELEPIRTGGGQSAVLGELDETERDNQLRGRTDTRPVWKVDAGCVSVIY